MDVRGINIFGAAGVATNVSQNGAVLDLRNAENVRLQVAGATTSTPVGTFVLYGTEDINGAEVDKKTGSRTAAWVPMNIPEQGVHGTGFTPFSDVTAAIAWDGSTALAMMLDLNDPPSYLYLKWVRTSGGSASVGKLSGRAGGRGAAG